MVSAQEKIQPVIFSNNSYSRTFSNELVPRIDEPATERPQETRRLFTSEG